MGGALLEGFERGFDLVDRYKRREANQARLARLDERNEQRYQEQRQRLADLDKRNDERFAQMQQVQAERFEQSQTLAQARLDASQQQFDWQRKQAADARQWQQDQAVMGAAWEYFRANGQVAPEHEAMFARHPGYDPRTFEQPKMREAVKQLGNKLDEVMKTGAMSRVNEPDTVALFDTVFQDKIRRSVGQYDQAVGANIQDVQFAGFVPVDEQSGEVSLALDVTYDNGQHDIKPMTQGRSTDPNDPVLTMTPEELVRTIQTKMVMADMIERPAYWDKVGSQFGATRQSPKPDQREAEYRKQLAQVERDMTQAIARAQANTDDFGRPDALTRIKQTYISRIKGLAKAYGMPEPQIPNFDVAGNRAASQDVGDLSDEELMRQLTSGASKAR